MEKNVKGVFMKDGRVYIRDLTVQYQADKFGEYLTIGDGVEGFSVEFDKVMEVVRQGRGKNG